VIARLGGLKIAAKGVPPQRPRKRPEDRRLLARAGGLRGPQGHV